MWQLFALGFTAGLALAIPVGPMAIFLINTTVSRGFKHGIVGAAGMATVDGIYALSVFLLGSLVSGWLTTYGFWLSMLGAIIILILGLNTLRRNLALLIEKTISEVRIPENGSVSSTFVKFVGATAVNPPTALYFLAIAPSIAGLGFSLNLESALWFAGSVLFGSLLWQETLVLVGDLVRNFTSNKIRAWLGFAGGLAMIALAMLMVARQLWK